MDLCHERLLKVSSCTGKIETILCSHVCKRGSLTYPRLDTAFYTQPFRSLWYNADIHNRSINVKYFLEGTTFREAAAQKQLSLSCRTCLHAMSPRICVLPSHVSLAAVCCEAACKGRRPSLTVSPRAAARSKTWAMASREASPWRGPTSCKPRGSPSSVMATGTVIAGSPGLRCHNPPPHLRYFKYLVISVSLLNQLMLASFAAGATHSAEPTNESCCRLTSLTM